MLKGGDRTFDAAAGDLVVDGAIGDGGDALGVVKAGKEGLTLGGENTYAGATTVNSGTALLTFGATTLTGSPTLAINKPANGGTTHVTLGAVTDNGNTITVTGNGLLAQRAARTGTGSLVLDSTFTGTNTLNQVNDFTGGITIKGGTLSANTQAAALPAGTAIVLGDSTGSADAALDFSGSSHTSTHAAGATVAGTVNVTSVAPGLFTNGSYTLLTCTGTFTDDGLTLGTVPSGFVATLVVDTLDREVRLVTKTPGTVVLVY